MTEVLRVEGIAKRFGPVTALREVNLHLNQGEVLGLLGDNGAGKSTLIKILSGYHQPDAGTIYIDGEPVELGSVSQARAHGIDTVYQDLALVNELSVFHNVFLNREIVHPWPFRLLNNREMRRRATEAIDLIGVDIPSVKTPVIRLSGGQRQAIAIARSDPLGRPHPAARRAARRDGRARGGDDPRPDPAPARGGRGVDRDDPAQLRARLPGVRPGQPAARTARSCSTSRPPSPRWRS